MDSNASRELAQTINSVKFDKIRAGYSLKFQRYEKRIHLKDESRATDALQLANGLIERQDFRQALKILNDVNTE